MKSVEQIEDTIKNLSIQSDAHTNRHVLDSLIDELEKTTKIITRANTWLRIRSFIMDNKYGKPAIAASMLCAALLSVVFLMSTGTTYALTQTVEAMTGIRSLHVKSYYPPYEEPIEGWLEFNSSDQGIRARLNVPAWADPSDLDGKKLMVWEDNKVHLYLEKKNLYIIMKDKKIAQKIFGMVTMLDPKTNLNNFLQAEQAGLVKLKFEPSTHKTDPQVVTGTFIDPNIPDPNNDTERFTTTLFNFIKGSDNHISKFVLLIDPATQLVKVMKFYTKRDGQDYCVTRLEYDGYNQPFSAALFDLKDEIPDNAQVVDQTSTEVGLLQGNLSDHEIARELVRQFLQALIDQDYGKAGRLLSGIPAERMQKTFSKTRFIRIVSIGQPTSEPMMGGLRVPCSVDLKQDGQIKTGVIKHAYVRQVHGQPQCWEITGGF